MNDPGLRDWAAVEDDLKAIDADSGYPTSTQCSKLVTDTQAVQRGAGALPTKLHDELVNGAAELEAAGTACTINDWAGYVQHMKEAATPLKATTADLSALDPNGPTDPQGTDMQPVQATP